MKHLIHMIIFALVFNYLIAVTFAQNPVSSSSPNNSIKNKIQKDYQQKPSPSRPRSSISKDSSGREIGKMVGGCSVGRKINYINI